MSCGSGFEVVHPQGEGSTEAIVQRILDRSLVVDTVGRRFHVEWDPAAPVTPLGQLVFFAQFLGTAGLFSDWVQSCPLTFTSPNAPTKPDLLGTITLSVLAGQNRYTHVTALRADTVNPQGFGMKKVCCEDTVRRAFADADAEACARWQKHAMAKTWMPALREPWIMDIDVTVKPIHGRQEGAEPGYNPRLKGRPCHAYHTMFVRSLRMVLDVEVHPGKQHGPCYGRQNLWSLWDSLPPECRPWLICGDPSYATEAYMAECEQRSQSYLFKLRKTPGIKELLRAFDCKGGWQRASRGWEGLEGTVQLKGWSAKRRIIVLRRAIKQPKTEPADGPGKCLPGLELELVEGPQYEHAVLVTNLKVELLSAVDLYCQRGDAENVYDELKNQWGWGGFTTKDLLRCQIAARNVALVYNWWTLFVRCAEPTRPREAITSRPLLLCAVGRVVESGRQVTIRLTSTHGEASRVQQLLTNLSMFLSGLNNTAEQLSADDKWQRIWNRILAPFRVTKGLLGIPSG
jgi:hypothetical protein